MIDEKMCRFIKAIAQTRSYSTAAKKLYIAQPYLSRYVQSLEKELGVMLFNRKRIPLEITPAGELLLEYIMNFEGLSERLKKDISQFRAGSGEHLSIGAWHYLGTYFLPPIVPLFMEKHPNVRLDVHEYDAKDIEGELLNGNIDFFLTATAPKSRAIRYRTIAQERPLMVAKKTPELERRYVLGHNDSFHPVEVPLLDFEMETFILLRPRQKMRDIAEEIFAAHRFTPYSVLETNTMSSCLNLVDSGCGLAFVGEIALRQAKFHAPVAYFSLGDIQKMPILVAYTEKTEDVLLDYFCQCAESALNRNVIPM